MSRKTICFILVVAAIAFHAAASEPEDTGVDWSQRVSELYDGLRQGRFAKVTLQATALGDEMAVLLVPGEKSSALLAAVVGLRAAAEAEMGHRDDALWHWWVAQGIHPGVFNMEFPVTGDGVAFLKAHPRRAPGALDGGAVPSAELVPPIPLDVPFPKPPEPLRTMWPGDETEDGGFEVEMVVDAQGRVRSPLVLGGGELPGKAYYGLEALRQWRFWPARLGRKVVPSLLRLNDFRPPSENEVFAWARERKLGLIVELLVAGRSAEALAAVQATLDEAIACDALLQELPPEAPDAPDLCDVDSLTALKALAELGMEPGGEALVKAEILRRLASERPSEGARQAGEEDNGFYAEDVEALVELAVSEARQGEAEYAACLLQSARRLGSETEPGLSAEELMAKISLPMDDGVEPPVKISAPNPGYTESARKAHIVGDVFLQAMLSEEGKMSSVSILRGLPQGLTAEVIKAVCRWRYEPATQDGEPVAIPLRFHIHFRQIVESGKRRHRR